MLNVRCWTFALLFFLTGSGFLFGQSFQKIHFDLDNATSIYATQNSIYVVEQGNNRLLKLDHSGNLLETIGGRGSGDYEFSQPVDVDATNGLKIFVTDYNNRRVQVFDRRGQYLSSIKGQTSFGNSRRYNPTQVAVSDMGEVYFADRETRSFQHFDLDYNLLDEFRIPPVIGNVDELTIANDEILILDKVTDTIHRLSLYGSYQGFYPAKNITAIFANQSGLWSAYKDRLVWEPQAGEVEEIPLEADLEVIDMHVEGGEIFLLTTDSIYKTTATDR